MNNNTKNVEIKILKPDSYIDLNEDAKVQNEMKIKNIIRDNVLPHSDKEYFRVDVKIKHKKNREPHYLVAYMLRKDIYLAEVVKIDIDEDYAVKDIEFDYNDDEDEDENEPKDCKHVVKDIEFDYNDDEDEDENEPKDYEYAKYDFIVGTPAPEIPTAKNAVIWLHKEATRAGLKSKILLGEEATIKNYQTYMTSGPKAFVNIGHGSNTGIMLSDGFLNYSWFKNLTPESLKPCVLYLNSCQVHNEPLETSIMSAGVRTFIGGILNLWIGPSEEVCRCFWGNVLKLYKPMNETLIQCENEKYPEKGAHGIAGDTGPFKTNRIKLEHAMWTHGHSMQIEYPEKIKSVWRIGPCIIVEGKPNTNNWFHFAIPTPVIVDQKRLLVGSVMIRYRTNPGALIHAVHIYDGENKIAAYDNLNLSSNGFSTPRFQVPYLPPVKWGLGISIGVRYSAKPANSSKEPVIEISSAGCDFLDEIR